MGITIPSELAQVASLVGVPAGLFAWDEDNLRAVADNVAAFAGGTIPSVADAESAAQRFMASTSGADADAFGGRWTTVASGGDAGDFLRTALGGAAVMAVAAGAIKIIKVGVLSRLAWCARQLAAAALPGAGTLRAAQAVGVVRVSIKALVDRLLKHFRERVTPAVQRANDNFRDILQGPRPAFAGVPVSRRPPLRAESPKPPQVNQVFRGKKGSGGGSSSTPTPGEAHVAQQQAGLLADQSLAQKRATNSAENNGAPAHLVKIMRDQEEELRRRALEAQKKSKS
ncbi:hypothetical protein Misp01_69980 [Microtetraspora sp. NBRC 13810]|uniref:hypothetical protein n=1 Tax=Microtetraspora sp. NBRC 13810 TaxID=3030990 RepID=UPI0024A1BF30|nr:hypothetical protein [Microtetraspora sp. NBRC 13810]GLW11870.1 hypothetical protein Misp01_69980 [Microtetraspora sp. NBRC 13810]